ncbi:MAG: M28 family peptidase [Bacteroidaceae bacterium]|nr:M28 family peptidase [Bacteroidaceae bacterium]
MRISIIALSLILFSCGGGKKPIAPEIHEPSAPVFSEDSAYAYIAAQCSYGPRTMNSAAHDSCGNWIARKFMDFGLAVYDQYAASKLYDGTPIMLRNIIASFNPEASVRIFISAHWDSRPWADNEEDESLHHTPIDGANDGASGIAVMLEIARQLKRPTTDPLCPSDISPSMGRSHPDGLPPHRGGGLGRGSVGIDFICWDAEDSGSHGPNSSTTWCLGSQYWAGVRHVEGYTARYGVNLDMVGGSKTIFCKEGLSMHYAPAIVDRIWSTAQRLGYGNYFKNEECGEMIDDHFPVNQGGIPCVDIIGLDAEGDGFPDTWHTVNDNLSHINKATLKAVGQTILEVIWNEN